MSKGLTSAWEGITGQSAADASIEAAGISAAAQTQGLDYLKETEAIPQELRQAGLQQLGGIYGLPGFEQYGNQQQLIEQAQASPLYQSQLGAGTESLARNINVTGGLRGGGGAADIAGFESNLLNQAYQQQLSGIQGLAGLPSAAPEIAQQYGQIGTTTALGVTGAAQAEQDALNNLMNAGAMAFSDVRMKDNIVKIGSTSNADIQLYKWDWKLESGKAGSEEGFLAQEVEKVYPDLVVTLDDGYKRIYKDKIEERLNGC